MTDNHNEGENGAGEHRFISWPPSPRTQIILIAVGFGLLNVILIAIWAITLYLTR